MKLMFYTTTFQNEDQSEIHRHSPWNKVHLRRWVPSLRSQFPRDTTEYYKECRFQDLQFLTGIIDLDLEDIHGNLIF